MSFYESLYLGLKHSLSNLYNKFSDYKFSISTRNLKGDFSLK